MTLSIEHLQVQDRMYFENPIFTIEDLQFTWNHPRLQSLDKKRTALVTTIVTIEQFHLAWSSSIRIMNKGQRQVKSPAVWMNHERINVREILQNELIFVGENPGKFYDSGHALHYWKVFTPEEVDLFDVCHPGVLQRRLLADGKLAFGSIESIAPPTNGETKNSRWRQFIEKLRGRDKETAH